MTKKYVTPEYLDGVARNLRNRTVGETKEILTALLTGFGVQVREPYRDGDVIINIDGVVGYVRRLGTWHELPRPGSLGARDYTSVVIWDGQVDSILERGDMVRHTFPDAR